MAIFIGGGLGSLARYGVSLFVLKSKFTNFPLATLVSNTLACLILALGVYIFKEKLDSNSWMAPLIITGFCGGFSTFSTFSNETFLLMQQGNYLWAGANILISVAVGVGLIWIISSVK
ncbi:MAG: fluoride efflux transporter CrcB [Flavobacteriia bacterium]